MKTTKSNRFNSTFFLLTLFLMGAGITFYGEGLGGIADANGWPQIERKAPNIVTKDYIGEAKSTCNAEMYRDISADFFPAGPLLGSLQIGQIVTLLNIYPNDGESRFSYKVQTADGSLGYSRVRLQLLEPLSERGEMISLHLSDPYEYEGDLKAVDKDIQRYSSFIERHPTSIYVPEALLKIASLHCYVLQFPLPTEEKQIRTNEIKNTYKRLFIALFQPKHMDKVSSQFDTVMADYARSTSSSDDFVNYHSISKFFGHFVESLIENVVPMSLKP